MWKSALRILQCIEIGISVGIKAHQFTINHRVGPRASMIAAAMLSTFQRASNSLRSSHHPPLASAKIVISTRFNTKQQAFLDFVLYRYVRFAVEELDQEKLTPLLRLKYHNSISDALADLRQAEEIGQVFAGFQKYLYQPRLSSDDKSQI
jgi:hypothetical protein